MDLNLADKVVLVTGGSKGIGRAIALKFAAEGCKKLIICARTEKTLMETRNEINTKFGIDVLAVVTDLTKTKDIDHLAEIIQDRFGGIDILINNTGGPPPGEFKDFSLKDWQDAVSLNLFSVIYCCQKFLPRMKEKGWGRIINMTSVSVKQPSNNIILSNVVRSGVVGLTKSMSNELARHNILINAVAPGYTETDRVKQIVERNSRRDKISVEEVRRRIIEQIPIKRIGTPEEIANVVVFLASDQASYVTGVNIQVDGGFVKGIS
ncbi:MAG: SDR family oxidoreductase [Candidatus Helarchaeota archaeon]